MHMHATKNTLVTVSGKKYVRLDDIQITIGIGFEFDYIPIRFYLFLVYLVHVDQHWSTKQGRFNDQIAHTD